VKAFACECGDSLHCENSLCLQCGRDVGFRPDMRRLSALEPGLDGSRRAFASGGSCRPGRNLVRTAMTARIIDVRSVTLLPELHADLTPFENSQWMGVLKPLAAYQMYRCAMQVRVRRPGVLRFLLQERCFPRSCCHAVCEAEACLQLLPRRFSRCTSRPDLLRQDELHRFIDELSLGLIPVNDAVVAACF